MCCWDKLPQEIQAYIISFIGQIYKDAATKIQIKWINYTIPLKVCSLLAREQLDYDLRDNWYNITDIRFVKYLEYFSKHAIFAAKLFRTPQIAYKLSLKSSRFFGET